MAPTKLKKRVNRNRKKNWRKFADISEVEEYLEDQRLDERLGEKISDRPDEELFAIETKVTSSEPTIKRKKEKQWKKFEKPRDIVASLHCFRAMKMMSKIKPIIGKARAGPVTRYKQLDDPHFKRKWMDKIKQMKRSTVVRAKEIGEATKHKNRLNTYDLWSDEIENNAKDTDPEVEELKNVQIELRGANRPKVSLYKFQKPSLRDAVEVPDEGSSYNPSFESHQALLLKAHLVEVKKLREEQRIKRAYDDFFPARGDVPPETSWLNEMSQGLLDDDDNGNAIDDDDDENVVHLRNKPVDREKKKSKAHRKRERLRREEEKAKRSSKKKNVKESGVFKLKTFKREIREAEAKSAERQKQRETVRMERMYRPHKLSTYKYQEPDIELNFTNELSGSLRTVKPDGNLLHDRYKSFQRRNLIETRIKQLKKKVEMNKYVKKSHRDQEPLV